MRRALSPHLEGRQILRASLIRSDVLAWPDPEAFSRKVAGARILPLVRRGKFLGFPLADGSRLWLHLRMTGQLSLVRPDLPLPAHTHVILSLDDGRDLRFRDQRRFGRLWLLGSGDEDAVTGIADLGPEPDALTAADLGALFAGRTRPVKSALLDQHLIAGLGNIYADEILFRAAIRPMRPAGTLSPAELRRLAAVMWPTLEEAVRRGVNCSRELFGEPLPSRQPEGWMVYGRRNMPCRCCGTPLAGVRIAGRSSVYCPNCQN